MIPDQATATPAPGGPDGSRDVPAARPDPAPRRRSRRGPALVGGVLVLAVGLLGAGAVLGGPSGSDEPAATSSAVRPLPAGASLSASIASLQAGLKRLPADDASWAQLGAAYVQQARLTADPSFYGKADGAFAESLRLRPAGNDAALAGQASLAAARHEFATAVQLSDAALAINAYSATALGVKVDGLTELGQYPAARDVLDRMLQLHPGVDSFTRASYAYELQGDVDAARTALERALAVAADPADKAFAHYYLGELAWNNGDVNTAAKDYDAALADDPAYVPPLTGRAKVKAVRGDVAGALADDRTAIAKQPQPATLLELGELLDAQGRTAEAQQQYAVLRATQQLYEASGQVVDAELSLFEADHGDPATALSLAQKAYAARPDSVVAQDAQAWALHVSGRDAEALPLARASLRTGYRSASLRYHLGVIEMSVGDRTAARADLQAALTLNPDWNPLQAPKARALLAGLS